jgi:amidase
MLFALLLAAAAPPFAIEEATIADLRRRIETKEITARALTDNYLARIAELDRRGPTLASIIEINPEATAIADRLDKSGIKGPLAGIPVLLKDNIDTGDKMMTSAGSLALDDTPAPADAFIVKKLRDAGAIILAKTNLSEWANMRSMYSTSGWSARGGQTRNPYALDRSPLGSSSGSAVAIAANLAVVAIGTETDGSIVAPAGVCAIVGLKPTIGLVSRTGIIPIAHSQDTAGPMTRTVADTAVLLNILAGSDPADPSTKDADKRRAPDYTTFLDAEGLKGARIGVMRYLFGRNVHADRVAEEAIEKLKSLGAVVVDPVEITRAPTLDNDELELLLFEFKADLAAYLAKRGPSARVKTIEEIIAFNETNSSKELVFFGQDLFKAAAAKKALTDRGYLTARDRAKKAASKTIDGAMAKHKLDALFGPTNPPAGLIDPIDGDYAYLATSQLPAVAGYPHITLPGGFAHGLPVGVSFVGRAFDEGKLLRLAYAFEQATKHRRPPRFLPTAQLTPPPGTP